MFTSNTLEKKSRRYASLLALQARLLEADQENHARVARLREEGRKKMVAGGRGSAALEATVREVDVAWEHQERVGALLVRVRERIAKYK